ncbi:MAG: tRNA 2-thiouridine(34) synthase MnmA [bacterium]|nr:tRNA 2-thiouridine(34) synthase MnmA [bacterium]
MAKKKKVFVAMSGGVDSSVAAALLKKSGKFDIVGAFAKGWPASPSQGGQPEGMVCDWKEERRDAVRAAAKLGIPFLTFDFSKDYEEKVVEYMKKEYEVGRTPNPDVMCNKYIKFGLFLEKALEMGADYIATGHYVRLKKEKGKYKLFQAKDKNKDQSYFLWTLTQEQLKYCLFPIGDYKKPDVRKLARKFGLHVAEKKDSQGLCFVGEINFALFLRKILPKKEGEIKTPDGKIVGYHDGAHFYTIGQRHGLNIPGGPYFVVAKDLKNNVLIVVKEKDEKEFYKKEVIIDSANWISELPKKKKKYPARIRYRQPLQECQVVSVSAGSATIHFEKPQRAVTAGQSLVLYKGLEMLGGGIIV